MQKGKAVEAVAAVMQQAAVGGEFHQPHRAARPGFDPKSHHARVTVVAGIKTGVGTEGFTGLEHPVEPAQTAGFEAVWIKGMGFGGFPKRQEVIAQAHHTGVGDVFQAQIEGIGHHPAGLLAAKHAPVEHLAGGFFS